MPGFPSEQTDMQLGQDGGRIGVVTICTACSFTHPKIAKQSVMSCQCNAHIPSTLTSDHMATCQLSLFQICLASVDYANTIVINIVRRKSHVGNMGCLACGNVPCRLDHTLRW